MNYYVKVKGILNGKYCFFIQFFLLFFLLFLLYSPMILGKSVPVGGDGLGTLFFHDFFHSKIFSGNYPLWNEMLSAGRPFIADFSTQGLYPISIALSFLNTQLFFYVFYAFHLAMGGTFFSMYLEEWGGIKRYVSIPSSLIYFFSVGVGGARKEHLILIACSTYLPVILYLILRYYHSRQVKFYYCAVMMMAFQFLLGFPQFAIYTDFFCAFYIICLEIRYRIDFQQWCRYTVCAAIMYIGLVSVQLVPFMELYSFYGKYGEQRINEQVFGIHWYHPMRLVMMLCPSVFGNDYWGSMAEIGSSYMDIEIFLGTVSLALLVFCVAIRYKEIHVWLNLVFMALVLLFACHSHFKLLTKILYYTPVIGSFRLSSRCLFIFYFFAMTLVAMGIDSFVERRAYSTVLKILGVELLFLLAVVVAGLNSITLSDNGKLGYLAFLQQFNTTIVILITAIVLFTLLRLRPSRKLTLLVCIALIVVDIFPYWKQNAALTEMRQLEGDDLTERFLIEHSDKSKVLIALSSMTDSSPIIMDSNLRLGFSVINSYTNFNDPRLSLLMTPTDILQPYINSSGEYIGFPEIVRNLQKDNDLLSMLGVKYIVDKNGYVPRERTYSGYSSGEKENVFQIDSLTLDASENYLVYQYPITIESGEPYQVSFTCDADVLDDDEFLYVDFYAGEAYDNMEQNANIVLKNGVHEYCYQIESGMVPENVDTVWVRIVAGLKNVVVLNRLKVDHLIAERLLNPYQLRIVDDGVKVFENTNCKEILFAPEGVKNIESKNHIYGHNEEYDFDGISYVENIVSFTPSKAEISEVEFEGDFIKARVDAEGDTFINFAQTYYPGWRAYVDGKRTDLYEVNGYIQGMAVPEGSHDIEFRYVPISFYVGAGISILFLILWGCLFVRSSYFGDNNKLRQFGIVG